MITEVRSVLQAGGKRVGSAACWLAPPLLCLALYWYGLKTWFLHDDFAWLHLRFEVHSWADLWYALFAPAAHGTFRPLSERAFFLVFGTLFGVNPLPFRICVFLTQFANLALVSSIARRLSGSRVAGFWAPLFWVANSNLGMVMAWTSAYMQVLCGFFLLLSFHFLLRYLETGRRRYYLVQWIPFLAGFLAMETNAVYPALAAVYALLCARKHFRSTLPLFIPSIVFVVLDLIFAPKQTSGTYAMHFDWAIPGTFLTYWRWSLEPRNLHVLTGFPEWVGPAGVWLFSIALAGVTVWAARRKQWLPLAFLTWFAILLLPVLPLRDHISPYYLTLPTIGLAMLSGCALASAWRGASGWRVAGALVAAAYFAISLPGARQNVRWWYERSRKVESMVRGVVRARELHPGKAILLTGVTEELFGGGILDSAFSAVGVSQVYLAPELESALHQGPETGNLSQYFLPPELVAVALEQGQLVVYRAGGPRLRNVTGAYKALVKLPPESSAPRRVEVASPLTAHLLGRTWYPIEGGFRWMPKTATVRLGGPRSAGERLYVSGYCAASLLAAGPLEMLVSVEGERYPAVRISKGDRAFEFDFSLPSKLIGRDSVEVEIQVSRTFIPPGEGRELGLAFRGFEIR